MLLSHDTAFARFAAVTPALTPAVPGLPAGTLLETETGWSAIEDIRAGDRVATIDGGFCKVTAAHAVTAAPAPLWCIPGGTLGTCSDLLLPEGHFLALNGPDCRRLFGLPTVLAPVAALAGFAGIHKRPAAPLPAHALRFAEEEVVWAQTGARILMPGETPARHFHRLDYGQTRALLMLRSGGNLAPDLAA